MTTLNDIDITDALLYLVAYSSTYSSDTPPTASWGLEAVYPDPELTDVDDPGPIYIIDLINVHVLPSPYEHDAIRALEDVAKKAAAEYLQNHLGVDPDFRDVDWDDEDYDPTAVDRIRITLSELEQSDA